ncbi:unnamed protein product [Vitrella brassicaformis CCMP3155]|uniref:FAD-binding domain-containing protein n=2 Tax=Vitrella brassicaformis TaxID=1169539 RepID=A0A0G4F4C0_VITBC|nr:unnamed protein product [Vitrella brassicaformis CCMP3155]|eukprot:CEM06889.1 unnamed protein product [Vitrella brassicaformis CCMP3155]
MPRAPDGSRLVPKHRCYVEKHGSYARWNVDDFPSAVDVLIVGAGPTGLALGADLAKRGVSFLLLDKCPRVVPYTRGCALHANTQEAFERWGVIDDVRERAVEVVGERLFVDGDECVDWTFERCQHSHYQYPILVAQSELERILTESVIGTERVKCPVWIHDMKIGELPDDGCEVTVQALEMTSDFVDHCVDGTDLSNLPLLKGSPVVKIQSKYIVGCDGAQSLVRQRLGINFNVEECLPYEFVDSHLKIKWGGLPADPSSSPKWNFMSASGRVVCCIALPHEQDCWRVICITPTAKDTSVSVVLDNNYLPLFPERDEIEQLINEVVPGSVVESVFMALGDSFVWGALQPGQRAPDARLAVVDHRGTTRKCRLHQMMASPAYTMLLAVCIPSLDDGGSARASAVCSCLEVMGCSEPPTSKETIMGRAIMWLVRLAGDVVKKLGSPTQSRWAGVRTMVVLTTGKATILPYSLSVKGQSQSSGEEDALAAVLQHMKTKFSNVMGKPFTSMELDLGFDYEGEVHKHFRLPIGIPSKPGAFFLIRPDGYVQNHGIAGDHLAQDDVLKCLDAYLP